MPDMNGYEVCKRLKDNPQTADIPVLFISAQDQVQGKVRAFQAGGVDYITKPFQIEEVLARIETHLTLLRYKQELEQANRDLEARVEERTQELSQLITAYERFVPHQFLRFLQKDKITDIQLADQIEYRMTIMFADIRDFTPLSERMAPQENFNFLNSYLSRISPVISRHKGFIDKYIGDAIMALFPDCADDGVKAAIDLQRELVLYNQHRESCGYIPVRVGISLHTGSLMLGIIGGDERMEGTVIADAVNLAARLESLNKLYDTEILISGDTLHDLEGKSAYHMRFLDEVRVKGRTDAVKLYEVFEGADKAHIEAKRSILSVYQEALTDYQKGDLEASRRGFLSVLNELPSDKPTQVFLQRIDRYLEDGLPENWGGIQVYQH